MKRLVRCLAMLTMLTTTLPVYSQVLCNGQICNSDGSGTMSKHNKIMYASTGSVTVGNNSSARTTMLPPALPGTSLMIPANRLPVGAALLLIGRGMISARTASPGTFMFYPNITPSGGSKTDLGGLTVTPLIGVSAHCEIWMMITQTSTGLQTSGVVKYGVDNSAAYSVIINPTNLIVASDPTVDRTFGIDAQWMTADPNNFVTPNAVTITYLPNT